MKKGSGANEVKKGSGKYNVSRAERTLFAMRALFRLFSITRLTKVGCRDHLASRRSASSVCVKKGLYRCLGWWECRRAGYGASVYVVFGLLGCLWNRRRRLGLGGWWSERRTVFGGRNGGGDARAEAVAQIQHVAERNSLFFVPFPVPIFESSTLPCTFKLLSTGQSLVGTAPL